MGTVQWSSCLETTCKATFLQPIPAEATKRDTGTGEVTRLMEQESAAMLASRLQVPPNTEQAAAEPVSYASLFPSL